MLTPGPPQVPSEMALFRYRVVSEVLVTEVRGYVRAEAVRRVANRLHLGPRAFPRKIGIRSLYRWLDRYEQQGIMGLEDLPRAHTEADGVLEPSLVSFLVAEKLADPRASIPQLLDMAVVAGLLRARTDVDRTTVWRHLKRRGVPTLRRHRVQDQRRFETAHRLQIVLCDGKHFRVGASLVKRVALFFIDDATRYVPTVVVGPSESTSLFLRGLYLLLSRVGRISTMYVDHGSGFISLDTQAVLASLHISHILGTAGYPEGKGKVERFNLTAQEHLLRHLTHPDVDPDFSALELRIAHFLRHGYNQWNHEGLGGKTSPLDRFLADERSLRPYEDEALRQHFFVTEERVVSNDHVVQLDGKDWEVPRGLARQRVQIRRDVLKPAHFLLEHEGQWLKLEHVRLVENAHQRRSPGPSKDTDDSAPTVGAALAKANAALAPITQPDGGFTAPDAKESP